MIKIEINGQIVEAHEGDMLIDVADEAKIPIPRFCYHKKLSIAANCRMCLVEVEGAPKALPACATPVTDGMKVHTRSPKARAAQKAVMEFLLINHPLDCPICDQGGECELQDVAFEYGNDVGKYSEAKRVVPDHDVGPLIATDMTRCIHCTRCVRFGQEISGLMELGAVGRSEWMEITTYVGKSITSEISGNIIDLCPVGALTSKPFRFKARAWEMVAHPSIAAHDSLGSHIEVHTYQDKVMRVVPRDNEAINETWLSDRDRFAYEGINSQDRLTVPLAKSKGQWDEQEWEDALNQTVELLKPHLNNPDTVGVLVSPNATVEELYLLRKLLHAHGVKDIETRLRQIDFRLDEAAGKPVAPGLVNTLPEIEAMESVLLVGSNLRYEIPLLNLRVRKAQLEGARVRVLNVADYPFTFDLEDKVIADPQALVDTLKVLVRAAAELKGTEIPAGAEDAVVSEQHQAWAKDLVESGKATIMVGAMAQQSPLYADFVLWSARLADLTGATINVVPQSANEVGAYQVGAVPANGGNIDSMLASDKKAWIVVGIDPELDTVYGARLKQALDQADTVISLTAYDSEYLRSVSDIMLPIAVHTETAGTFVNATGDWQSFKIASAAPGDAKPLWKILRVLGNLLDMDGFDYVHADEVLEEAKAQTQSLGSVQGDLAIPARTCDKPVVLGEWSLYSVDPIVRRSEPLQKAAGAARPVVRSAIEADEIVLNTPAGPITLPNEYDESVAPGVVLVPMGLSETADVTLTDVSVAAS
ncbi:NADH dehydrogenase subunit G [Sulfurivirga caldicuralii]|uniref:NADH-quinone oxidoreductase n=1 Tax=Sulfurivirga caldicuralii TaxID=364032 RepID=A0A1N6ETS3_9GAMM|nr:NADH-quinone oxidoreductase subunit NuoG [Sulfurivirga caldicuralii]SIN86390.1 NADH dehydrogenase subunit G [Sulfurivirga caldicuralii]